MKSEFLSEQLQIDRKNNRAKIFLIEQYRFFIPIKLIKTEGPAIQGTYLFDRNASKAGKITSSFLWFEDVAIYKIYWYIVTSIGIQLMRSRKRKNYYCLMLVCLLFLQTVLHEYSIGIFMITFPFYKQLDAMDCGSSCLRMISKFYGKCYSLQYLRERSFITREGVSLLGISDAAESIGLK